MNIRTATWFTEMPAGHVKIGISRGVPRRMAPGYLMFRRLAPGSWFNSVDADEYVHRYRVEVLGRLDPRQVAQQLADLAGGRIPVFWVCYERVGQGQWCHRALAAAWLAEALGQSIPEVGFELWSQHPLMPAPEQRAKRWIQISRQTKNIRAL